MSKFKEGDQVVVLKDSYSTNGKQIGATGKIIFYYSDTCNVVIKYDQKYEWADKLTNSYSTDELELL